jgi:hypothetical protein
MSAVLDETERICSCCGRLLPLRLFRRRRRGYDHRQTQCDRCHMEAKRRLTAEKRDTDLNRFWSGVSRNAKLERYERVERLTTAAIARFGGLERIATFWMELTLNAREQDKPHIVLRSLNALTHMIVVAAKSQAAETEAVNDQLRTLSEEQLAELQLAEVKMAIRENPELAIAAACEIGWTVIPPDETTDHQEDADG